MSSLQKTSLKGSIEACLQYLGVPKEDDLWMKLEKATPSQLPGMFFEMTAALSDLMEDKTLLNNLRIELPNGKVVNYEEAQKYAQKHSRQSTLSTEERKTVKNVSPKVPRFVDADAPYSKLPKGTLKSTRER